MNAADAQLDLQVRVAVNTGEAIVSLGAKAELGEAMVAGDVVNTASRLQTAAPTNAVLVGEGTYRATRGLFDYEQVEPLVAKGKSAPLHAWLALDARTGPGERASNTAPMVGRVQRRTLSTGSSTPWSAEGRPHLATVVGESGIGKTRLATEFTAQAESKGVRILRGRSLPYGTSTPYGPFAQQVKQFAGHLRERRREASLEKLGTAVAEIVPRQRRGDRQPPRTPDRPGAEGEVANRQILFYAARRFGESLARTGRPSRVRRLHWAESGTLDLLEVLAARLRDVPVMLLALARPGLLLSALHGAAGCLRTRRCRSSRSPRATRRLAHGCSLGAGANRKRRRARCGAGGGQPALPRGARGIRRGRTGRVARRAADDDPRARLRPPRRTPRGGAQGACSTPPSSARPSGAARSSAWPTRAADLCRCSTRSSRAT